MNKSSIIERFEQFLKNKFPSRRASVCKDLPAINTEPFNDRRFDKWRKNK